MSVPASESDTVAPQPSRSADVTTAPLDSSAAEIVLGSAVRPTLPGYEVLDELGRGGMGVVYLARQKGLNRLVALKMILAGGYAGESERRRFRAEAEAVARLRHPNIVQVYEVGEHEGLPFFSLEYVDGGTLADRLDGTPLPPSDAASLTETLARAVHHAHTQGVIHRDLKPANVLLASERETASQDASVTDQPPHHPTASQAKIADFGLAKKLDDVGGNTASGAIVGTPSYMAPEQARGEGRQVGAAADVYALGAVLYELLTGRPPFKAATPLDTILEVIERQPVPPTQLHRRCPRDLETICLKCLHKEPGKRYASAEGLADDLHRYLAGEPIRARPISPAARLWSWCRRNPTVAGLSALLLALLLLSVLNLWASLNSVEAIARHNQQLLAESLASRLDERIRSDAQAVALLSRELEVRALLAAPVAERPGLMAAVRETLDNVLLSNSDFSSAFVLAPDGTALASTSRAHLGRNYAFRDYFREAIAGRPYQSKVLIGTSTREPGMYYSAPVRGNDGAILGVVVVKMEARAIWQAIDKLDPDTDSAALLTDEDGIVIAHRDRSRLFHSLTPLSDEDLRRVAPRERFQSDTVPSLDIPALSALHGATAPGHIEYRRPDDGARRVVAYAPLKDRPWVLAVDMDARQLGGPGDLLAWRHGIGVAVLACLAALLAVPYLRRRKGR